MAKRYTSARGSQVDFDILHHQNKNTIAVGNANMNANGDTLGEGGKIIRRVDDIPVENQVDPNAAYNEANPKSTKMVSLKNKVDDLPEIVQDIPDNLTKTKVPAKLPDVKNETATKSLEEKQKPKRKIVDSED